MQYEKLYIFKILKKIDFFLHFEGFYFMTSNKPDWGLICPKRRKNTFLRIFGKFKPHAGLTCPARGFSPDRGLLLREGLNVLYLYYL